MAIANYSKVCNKNIPGNRFELYITEIANVTSVTETSNEVSAITATAGAFKKVKAEIDSVQYTSDGTFTTAGAETQNLIMGFGTRSTELEIFLQSLKDNVPCGLAAIWVDGNAKAWLAGVSIAAKDGVFRPFNSLTTNFDSGLLPTDTGAAKYTITLSRLAGYAPVELDPTLTTGVLSGSSAFISWT